jgi:hypothetical protein
MTGTTLQERATRELRLTAGTNDRGTVEVSFLYHTVEMRLQAARMFARELLSAVAAAERQFEHRRLTK